MNHGQEEGVVSRRVFLAGSASGLALASLGATNVSFGGPATRVRLAEAGPMIPPVPAILLTVNGTGGSPDEISVVWTFIVNGHPPQVGVSIDDKHVAKKLVEANGAFVLNVPVAGIVVPFDRVDMKTEEAGDKFKLSGLTRGRAVAVDAPTVEECPIHVECKVLQSMDVPPTRKIFVAEVVATTVLEGACDKAGRLNVADVPFFGMTAGSGELYTMGKPVGHIGQTIGRKDIKY